MNIRRGLLTGLTGGGHRRGGLLTGGGGSSTVGPPVRLAERARRIVRSERFVTGALLVAALVLFMLPNMLVKTAPRPAGEVAAGSPGGGGSVSRSSASASSARPARGAGASNRSPGGGGSRASGNARVGSKPGGGGGGGGGAGAAPAGPRPAGGAAVFQRMQRNVSAVVKLDAPMTLTAAVDVALLPRVDVDPRQMPKPLTAEDSFVTLANIAKVRFDGLPKRGSIPANYQAVLKRFTREDDGSGRHGDGSCAVVGNGGVILGTGASRAIESHDVVIRFNQAPVMNDHKDVGDRTNFRALSKGWIHKYSLPDKGGLSPADLPLEWGAGLILTGAGQGITQQATSLLNSLKDKWKRPDVQVLVVTPKVEATAKDLLLYYRQRVKEAGFVLATKGMAPSSGFVTIYALLQTCDHVSVYGFGRQSPEAGGKEPPYRYYERSKAAPSVKEAALTAMDVELAALRAMHRESRLVLCMGNEPKPEKCGNLAHRKATALAREYGRSVDTDEIYNGKSKDGSGGGGSHEKTRWEQAMALDEEVASGGDAENTAGGADEAEGATVQDGDGDGSDLQKRADEEAAEGDDLSEERQNKESEEAEEAEEEEEDGDKKEAGAGLGNGDGWLDNLAKEEKGDSEDEANEGDSAY